jgi:hypothetical protein
VSEGTLSSGGAGWCSRRWPAGAAWNGCGFSRRWQRPTILCSGSNTLLWFRYSALVHTLLWFKKNSFRQGSRLGFSKGRCRCSVISLQPFTKWVSDPLPVRDAESTCLPTSSPLTHPPTYPQEHFTFRNHLCITFELLSVNLYEFVKQNNFMGLSLGLIRRFAHQVLVALRYLRVSKRVGLSKL